MRFSPAVERDGELKGQKGNGRRGKRGPPSRIKVLLRSAFATAFASLLRSRGTMTNPRRLIVATPDGVWGKAQEREENVERNSTGVKKRRGDGGGERGECAERVGVRVGWRSLAADYMDHCARTTASAEHVEVKEEKSTFARESLGRKSGKTRAKGWAFLTRYCRSRD